MAMTMTPVDVFEGQTLGLKKPFFPEQGDESQKIMWLLSVVRVKACRSGIMVTALARPIDAALCKSWLKQLDDFEATSSIRESKYSRQIQLSFSTTFCNWVTKKAAANNVDISTTAFQLSLIEANKRVAEFNALRDSIRTELLEAVYKKQGRRGCINCGLEDNFAHGIRLQFDHESPSEKIGEVGRLLGKGKFEDARKESQKCMVRCMADHRAKTFTLSEWGKGRPRAPISEDNSIEIKREDSRRWSNNRAERGRKRLEEAKISRESCVSCGKKCTLLTIHDFSFNHIDPEMKKFNLGTMAMAGKRKFEVELAKTQLLCTVCHHQRTQEQVASGSLTAKRQKKQQA